MAKVIRWGMVGCGDVTEVKSGPGFYKAENSMLYGVTNRTYEKAVDYAARHGVKHVYHDIDEMIADGQVDAIYVATPPGSHKHYAAKCAQARIPCYIEKPVAMNYEEHLALIEMFEQADTPAFAAYYRRKLPRFNKVKELIDTDAIGEIQFVHLSLYRQVSADEMKNESWRIHPDVSGGGIFMDVGVHQLDIMAYLLGNIVDVNCHAVNRGGFYQPEDTINALLLFESGVHMTANWCFVAGYHEDEIKIVGSKGQITLSCFGDDAPIVKTASGDQVHSVDHPEHVHQPLIQTIVNELNGNGHCPSNLKTSLQTAWVCEQINRVYLQSKSDDSK